MIACTREHTSRPRSEGLALSLSRLLFSRFVYIASTGSACTPQRKRVFPLERPPVGRVVRILHELESGCGGKKEDRFASAHRTEMPWCVRGEIDFGGTKGFLLRTTHPLLGFHLLLDHRRARLHEVASQEHLIKNVIRLGSERNGAERVTKAQTKATTVSRCGVGVLRVTHRRTHAMRTVRALQCRDGNLPCESCR